MPDLSRFGDSLGRGSRSWSWGLEMMKYTGPFLAKEKCHWKDLNTVMGEWVGGLVGVV